MERKALISIFSEASTSEWCLHSDVQLQDWLEAFAERLNNRADEVMGQVHQLLDHTGQMEQELHNIFNSFRGLSSTQFVENRVYEEDETIFSNQGVKVQEQAVPSQSYEDDIIPRYKDAMSSAWTIYEQHINKSYKRAMLTGISKSRLMGERWHKQLPHIIGTEEFMRDNSCGLAEDRSSGMEVFDSDSDTEKDGSDMAAEMSCTGVLPEGEWSGTDSDVSDDQIGGFEPAVSAALDFKAMLEAALRSSYTPCDDAGMLPSYNSPLEQRARDNNTSNAAEKMLDNVPRIMSEKEDKHNKGISDLAPSTTQEGSYGEEVEYSHKLEDNVNIVASSDSLGVDENHGLSELSNKEASNSPTSLAAKTVSSRRSFQKDIKMVMPEKSSASEELPGGYIKRSNFLSEYSNTISLGGLFDDEEDDGEFQGLQNIVATMDSSSRPTIPEGLFERLHASEEKTQEEKSIVSNKLNQSTAMQLNNTINSQETSKGNSAQFLNVKSPTFAEGLFASGPRKTVDIFDRFALQGSMSGNVPLKDSLSLLRKGLFDDDDEEDDDRSDLFKTEKEASRGTQSSNQFQGNHTSSITGEANSLTRTLSSHVGPSPLSNESKATLQSDLPEMVEGDAVVDLQETSFSGSFLEDKGSSAVAYMERLRGSQSEEHSLQSDKAKEGMDSNGELTTLREVNQVTPPVSASGLVAEKYPSSNSGEDSDSWSSSAGANLLLPGDSGIQSKDHLDASPSSRGFQTYQDVEQLDEQVEEKGKEDFSDQEKEVNSSMWTRLTDVGSHQGGIGNVQVQADGKMGLPFPLNNDEDSKRDFMDTSVVPSRASSQISSLHEQLNLTLSRFPLQPGSSLVNKSSNLLSHENSQLFSFPSVDGESKGKIQDASQLFHVTMSRPMGSSKRRAPTTGKRSLSSGLPTTDPSSATVLPVEVVTMKAGDIKDVQEPQITETSGGASSTAPNLLSWEEDEEEENELFGNLPQKMDQNLSIPHIAADKGNNQDSLSPNVDVSMQGDPQQTFLATTKVTFPILNRRKSLPISGEMPPQNQAVSQLTKTQSKVMSLSSVLFGDEDDEDEFHLFGPLHGGNFPSSKPGDGKSVFDGNVENLDQKIEKTETGTGTKPASQPANKMLSASRATQSTGILRKMTRTPLFDDDDDD